MTKFVAAIMAWVLILSVGLVMSVKTLRVTGLSDVVHSAGGNVATGNILSTVQLVFGGAVTCTGVVPTGKLLPDAGEPVTVTGATPPDVLTP